MTSRWPCHRHHVRQDGRQRKALEGKRQRDHNHAALPEIGWKRTGNRLPAVMEHILFNTSANLTFEVSDGSQPIQLYRAGEPCLSDSGIVIELSPRPASCKPRDRWLAEQATSVTSTCCGLLNVSKCCA